MPDARHRLRQVLPLSLSIPLAALVAACDPGPKKPTLNYDYGVYDDLVYDMYANPGEATPEVQIERLAAEIEQTRSRGRPVPPGVHAHLGYMHYLTGNTDAALIEFEAEQAAYPESTTFIEGITGRLEGN